jgi:RNA polymerase sigma factor (sigma-70 family)
MGPALQAASAESEAAEQGSFPAPHLNRINHSSTSQRRSGGPPPDATAKHARDVARLSAVRSGDRTEAVRFVRDISETVWSACRLLTGDENDTRRAFGEVMAALTADRFARLGGYAGRGTLETFVALTVRDLLAERMLQLLQSDQKQAWHAFERLFETDIGRLIRKRLPGASEDARRDAYQDICVALIEGEYRRIRTYGGSGSFAGFVLRTVDHLLIDFVRSVVGRRRPLPKCVSADHLDDVATEGELSPEEHIISADEDQRLAGAIAALTEAMSTLAPAERLYLTIALSGSVATPAREIARLMQRPVEDIYKLKQRVLLRLREIASADSKIKTWRASV